MTRAVIKGLASGFGGALKALAPTELLTHGSDVAAALSQELKHLGVQNARATVKAVSERFVDQADERFREFYNTLKKSMGLTDIMIAAISAPQAINFGIIRPPEVPPSLSLQGENPGHAELCLAYCQRLTNARPSPDGHDKSEFQAKLMREWELIIKLTENKPAAVIKKDADDGVPKAVLDYGLR